MSYIRSKIILAVVAALLIPAGGAAAQSYPAKPVRLVSPYPPGGANDILARIIGQKLGADLVAKAPPDGYTLLMGQASNLSINISLMGKLPFDPIKDFAPITLVATTPNLLVVHPSL